MENYTELITKYSADFVVSFQELNSHFSQIYPKNILIYDLCVTKFLISFAHNLSNYYKWKSSPNIINEIEEMIKTNFSTIKYSNEYIKLIHQLIVQKRQSPSRLESELRNYLGQLFKTSLNSFGCIEFQHYVKFILRLNDNMYNVFNKYKVEWDLIDEECDKICNILLSNYIYLESDKTLVLTIETIDKIQWDAMMLVVEVSQVHESAIKKIILEADIKTDNINELVNNYKKLNCSNFDKQINEIYEQVIKKYNFSDDVNQLLMICFENEKSKHYLSFIAATSFDIMVDKLDNTEWFNSIKKLIKND